MFYYKNYITYTPFHQPETIEEGDLKLSIIYAADQQRRVSILEDEVEEEVLWERVYQGNHERLITDDGQRIRDIYYISSPAGLVSIVVREDIGTEIQEDIYYTFTDHLGSILLVTDEQANAVARPVTNYYYYLMI